MTQQLSSSEQDIVAVWQVPLQDGVHKIEFEHGTTSGKRVIRVDGKEILRKDWMFKLVGRELFTIGSNQSTATKCAINVEPAGAFAYEYTLEVNGKTFEKFREQQNKSMQTWNVDVSGRSTRIVLDKETMDVWVNGDKVTTAGEFVDDGTETHFEIGTNVCYIKAISSGRKRTGIVRKLFINGNEVVSTNTVDD